MEWTLVRIENQRSIRKERDIEKLNINVTNFSKPDQQVKWCWNLLKRDLNYKLA